MHWAKPGLSMCWALSIAGPHCRVAQCPTQDCRTVNCSERHRAAAAAAETGYRLATLLLYGTGRHCRQVQYCASEYSRVQLGAHWPSWGAWRRRHGSSVSVSGPQGPVSVHGVHRGSNLFIYQFYSDKWKVKVKVNNSEELPLGNVLKTDSKSKKSEEEVVEVRNVQTVCGLSGF